MPWLEWFAFKHPLIIHVPIAVAVMLPLAVMASQRPGRGIRPWWMISRFLTWWAGLALIPAAVSGLLLARKMGILAEGSFLAKATSPDATLLRMHQILALASLALAVLTLRLFYRRRQDHQGLGFLPLLSAFLFCGALIATGLWGARMSRPVQTVVVKEQVEVKSTAPAPVAPAQVAPAPPANLIARMLDYASLEPIQREPVKTTVHGLRWIRTWVTPSAAQAYREGQTLPPGTLVVLASSEDRWGRPGPEPGPLYGLEIQPDGRPSMALYWGRVPEAKRGEMAGADRVEWRPGNANLEACMGCHAQGMAPLRDRSNVYPFRKPKEESAAAQ